jgi:hypothetical protein
MAVYNLEASGNHNYYVSKTKVLAHNCAEASTNIYNGLLTKTNRALELAEEFLGKGYKMEKPGRYVSAKGDRVVRIGDNDILGRHSGGRHMNFEILGKHPKKPGKMEVIKNYHIYLSD